MAKKVFDAVATVGEYKDKNGDTKKRYVNVGAVFENDNGQMSFKLETIPVGPNWSGWISFYEPKTNNSKSTAGTPKPHSSEFDVDDVPF